MDRRRGSFRIRGVAKTDSGQWFGSILLSIADQLATTVLAGTMDGVSEPGQGTQWFARCLPQSSTPSDTSPPDVDSASTA
jgi:hypothetical protein